jgi:acyl-CoA thioester hydrolase
MSAMYKALSLSKKFACAPFEKWENRLKIEYLIFDAVSGRKLTKGYTSQVAVHIEKREMCFQSPQVLLDCLNAWPEFKAE